MTATHAEAIESQIAENVTVLMHRAGLKLTQLATAVGISQPTMSRRMLSQQPWMFWEVQVLAEFFCVTLSEITTDLPSRDEWQARWVARLKGFEPLTFCSVASPRSRNHLRLVGLCACCPDGFHRQATLDTFRAVSA